MEHNRESIKRPHLVEKNFVRSNGVPEINTFQRNSWYLNIFLFAGFMVFAIIFLWIQKNKKQEPEVYPFKF